MTNQKEGKTEIAPLVLANLVGIRHAGKKKRRKKKERPI
jgi:hypothetical protein